MRLHANFILASESPRRRKILEQAGISFLPVPSGIVETIEDSHTPEQVAEHLATQKATAVATDHPDSLVLGADTLVVCQGVIFGKPSEREEAVYMLRQLSGSTHIVHTGIALVHTSSKRTVTAVESTEVTFGQLTETEIATYVESGLPLDKAGAYGIQDGLGSLFIERISGDYYNVVGLPLRRLYVLLKLHYKDLITV